MSIFKSLIKNLKKNEGAREQAQSREREAQKNNVPAYAGLVTEIDRMIAANEVCRLSKQENSNLVTYTNGKHKILTINKNTDPPCIYFLFSGANHKAKQLGIEGLRPVSKNEAKQKRYGPAKALYRGDDATVIRTMLQEMK